MYWPDAVCAQPQHDPDLWFSTRARDVARAKGLCGTCPIASQCLTEALDYHKMTGEALRGIHGGLDERELRTLVRRQNRRTA